MKDVSAVFRSVHGEHCTVFGSAPNRRVPQGYSDTVMICVNGSSIGLSRDADITVMYGGIVSGAIETCRQTLGHLRGRNTDKLLLIQAGKFRDAEEKLRELGYGWREIETLPAQRRAEIIEQTTGRKLEGISGKHVPSNGLLAVLLAVAAGAKRIDMCGFSLAGGHYYITGDTVRGHLDQDPWVFEWLADNAPVFSTDQPLCDRFGIPKLAVAPE